jgi:hypothetical protein
MLLRRNLGTGGLLVLLALALSGCIHVTVGMNINSDGTGTYMYTIGLSKQLAGFPGESEAKLMQSLNQVGQTQVQHYGGTYRVFDDGSYLNEEWDHGFSTISQLNSLILTSLQSSASSSGSTTTNDTAVMVTQQGSTFHVTGTLDFSTSSVSGSPSFAALLQDAYLRVAITMPSITAHSSDATVSGNTATITAKYGEKKTIDVTGGPGGVSPLVWILIALVVLAGLGVGVYFFLRRRSAQATPGLVGAFPLPASGPFGANPQMPSAPPSAPVGGYAMPPSAPPSNDTTTLPYPGYQPPSAAPDVPPDAPPTVKSEN